MTRRTQPHVDVCLVVPPFDTINFPTMGVPVLVAALKARGIGVAAVYGNVVFAARVGDENYLAINAARLSTMAGDRLFVRHAYPPAARKTLGPLEPLPERLQDVFGVVAPQTGPFLQTLARKVLARNPRIVGITTSFQQNMAAIALARIIKRRRPEIKLVLGGANCAEPMGSGLLKVFPWIDHLFAGEADVAFPDFCERVLRHGDGSTPQLVVSAPIADMGTVHAPDFGDYFATMRFYQERGQVPKELPSFLTLETSRGCWWGQKSHCTFCGLNGEGMGFRVKSPERVLGEVRGLVQAWGVRPIHFADNIMPMTFLRDVLPALAAWPERPKLFFEVKSNLRDEQLAVMAEAGLYMMQPGIESLSSHVLKLMRKGVSGLQNLALLRDCRSRGILVQWNLLIGFPGEETADYQATMALVPKIVHLQAPSGVHPVIVDRYSPYHYNHRDFGIPRIVPIPNYLGLYPKDAPVGDIAYHFRGRYTTALTADKDLVHALRKTVAQWTLRWMMPQKQPVLEVIDTGAGELAVVDTRGTPAMHVISRRADSALAFFERPRPLTGNPPEYQGEVEALRAKDLVIEHEGALLSVVTRDRSAAVRPAAETRSACA